MNQTLQRSEKVHFIIGIVSTVLILAISVLLKWMGLTIFSYNNVQSVYLKILYPWVILGLLALYVAKIEKHPFLLWDEQIYPWTFYLKSVFKIMFLSFIVALIIGLSLKLMGFNSKSDIADKLIALLHKDRLLVLFVSLTAGITEELICRGYLLTRLEMLINKPAVSIAVSAVFFGILHISYGTIAQVLLPFCLGLLYATHYYKYRNIKVIIACHFLWDFIGLYIKTR